MTAAEEVTIADVQNEDTVWSWMTRDDVVKHYHGKQAIADEIITLQKKDPWS